MYSTQGKTHSNDKGNAQPRTLAPAARSMDWAAGPQIHPEIILQRVQLDPGSLTAGEVMQLQRMIGNRAVGRLMESMNPIQAKLEKEEDEEPMQMKPKNTGMLDHLKTGVENLSGISMDDVRVHHHSWKPMGLGTLANTQGTDIHVAPQKEGWVEPTGAIGRIPLNDSRILETEVDAMGGKARQLKIEKIPENMKESNVNQGFGFMDNRSESKSSKSTQLMIHSLMNRKNFLTDQAIQFCHSATSPSNLAAASTAAAVSISTTAAASSTSSASSSSTSNTTSVDTLENINDQAKLKTWKGTLLKMMPIVKAEYFGPKHSVRLWAVEEALYPDMKDRFGQTSLHVCKDTAYSGCTQNDEGNFDEVGLPIDFSMYKNNAFRIVITFNLSKNDNEEKIYATFLHEWDNHAIPWMRTVEGGLGKGLMVIGTNAKRADSEHKNYANMDDRQLKTLIAKLKSLSNQEANNVLSILQQDRDRYDKQTGKMHTMSKSTP